MSIHPTLSAHWKRIQGIASVLSIVCVSTGTALAAEPAPSAQAFLEAAADSIETRPAYGFHALHFEYAGPNAPAAEDSKPISEFDVKVQGEKLAVMSVLSRLDRTTNTFAPRMSTQHVWDGRLYWRRTEIVDSNEPISAQVEEGTYFPNRQRSNADYGAFLEGYLMHSPIGSWATQLLAEAEVQIAQRQESVDGFPCWLVTANTGHGEYRLWVDAEHGYSIRRGWITLSPDDIAWGISVSQTSQSPGRPQIAALEFEIRDVAVEQVGETWLGASGTFVQRFRYEDGGASQTTKVVKRSDLRRLQEAEVAESFVMRLAEGSTVEYVYPNGTILDYRYAKGNLSPITDELTLSQIEASLPEMKKQAAKAGVLASLDEPNDVAKHGATQAASLLPAAGKNIWLLSAGLLVLAAVCRIPFRKEGSR